MDEAALRRHIETYPVEGSPAAMREGFARLIGDLPAPDEHGVHMREDHLGGLRALRLEPEDAEGLPILHFHGGGYVFGSPETHLGLGLHLARASGRTVWLPAYPLAPEHPWPAQKDAARACLAALGEAAVLSGDSAGGHLALVTARDTPRIASRLVLFSPNTSRAYGRSRTRGEPRDAMNDHGTDDRLGRMTFRRQGAADPDQTLLGTDLSGLSAAYIDVGSEEILLDEALGLSQQFAFAGVAHGLRVRAGFHLIQLFAAHFAAGAESVRRAGVWLRHPV